MSDNIQNGAYSNTSITSLYSTQSNYMGKKMRCEDQRNNHHVRIRDTATKSIIASQPPASPYPSSQVELANPADTDTHARLRRDPSTANPAYVSTRTADAVPIDRPECPHARTTSGTGYCHRDVVRAAGGALPSPLSSSMVAQRGSAILALRIQSRRWRRRAYRVMA